MPGRVRSTRQGAAPYGCRLAVPACPLEMGVSTLPELLRSRWPRLRSLRSNVTHLGSQRLRCDGAAPSHATRSRATSEKQIPDLSVVIQRRTEREVQRLSIAVRTAAMVRRLNDACRDERAAALHCRAKRWASIDCSCMVCAHVFNQSWSSHSRLCAPCGLPLHAQKLSRFRSAHHRRNTVAFRCCVFSRRTCVLRTCCVAHPRSARKVALFSTASKNRRDRKALSLGESAYRLPTGSQTHKEKGATFSRNPLICMVALHGLEPRTCGL